jgi:hypothetical protein
METHFALSDSGAQNDTYLQSAIVATIVYQWQHPTP